MRHPFLRTLAGSAAPAATDPNFENVTLLLHGDGTNGGQNNTFVDGSTNNFTITRNGNTTQGTFSPYGDNWSNYFDGTGDYLSIPDNAAFDFGTGDFTIECWIYIAGNSTADAAGARTAAALGCFPTTGSISNAYGLFVTGSTTTTGTGILFQSYQSGTGYSISATTTVSQNAWHHIAAARSGTTTKVFLDGSEVASGTLGNQTVNSANTITIGRIAYTGYLNELNGYISNLRVLKGTAQYTGTYTVPTSPLTAITNTSLLTCQSTSFFDKSSNAFAITRLGNVSVQRFSPFSPTAAYAAGTIGGSGYFDGSGDYLSTDIANNVIPTTGNFTAEAWIYLTADTTANLFSFRTNASSYAGLRVVTQNNDFQLLVSTNGTSWAISSGTVGAGYTRSWNHIAVVRNSGTFTVYVGGTSAYTSTAVASGTALITGDVNFIGATNPAQQYLNGYISDVRVTQSAVYTAAFTPPTAPLAAITNTSLLLNFQNAAIRDNAMMAVPETVGNAQIDTTTKKFGTGSVKFDGTGDALKFIFTQDFVFGSSNFTIECWVNVNSLASARDVFSLNARATLGYASVRINILTDGSMRLLCASADQTWINTTTTATSTIVTGTWHHLAAVRNGSAFNLYVDGVSKLNYTSSASLHNFSGISFIGAENSSGSPVTVMDGYIDDFRITKGVARYTANFTAPTAALPDL